ncbi:hypothetical protein [Phytoactinopolyspora halotolerans]|uniref:Lipoprotein n=1 Tax=Phytoactinopolyspora halotolerans TaxID=1981512 RepID=A0A6L9S1W4_9ACTN|nr:hypothetical protein [Phytoactinopolyspora halotolerans]NED99484.1 hypothetical protein [Phytoactinopolyspora halotolerans]
MTTMTRFAALVGTATLALPLVACGDDSDNASTGDYCELVQEMQDSFASSDNASPEQIEGAVGTFRNIADAAPGDIAPEWQTLADWVEAYSEIDSSDPEAWAEVENDEELVQLRADAEPASTSVEEHVQAECDITLGE